MPQRAFSKDRIDFSTLQPHATREYGRAMSRSHVHSDIEVNLLLHGSMTYGFGGQEYLLRPGEVLLFWAGYPHQVVEASPECEGLWAYIPISWVLRWAEIGPFVGRLIGGEIIVLPRHGDALRREQEVLEDWSDWSSERYPETDRIRMLSMETWLRLVAHRMTTGEGRYKAPRVAPQQEKMLVFICRHFHEPITIRRIAAEVNLHPKYAMTLFKSAYHLSLWDYVTRLRVSYAQQLLLQTDETMEVIAGKCGFNSRVRFHAAFLRVCGVTPGDCRSSGIVAHDVHPIRIALDARVLATKNSQL